MPMPYVWQPDYILFEVEWQRERQRVFGFAIYARMSRTRSDGLRNTSMSIRSATSKVGARA